MSHKHKKPPPPPSHTSRNVITAGTIIAGLIVIGYFIMTTYRSEQRASTAPAGPREARTDTAGVWITRAFEVNQLFRIVYTPCWEGAYGAIGDAYLYKATHDASLMRFHINEHPLVNMCVGTWVDDRAWVCLAEILWWNVTGKQFHYLIDDARHRYDEARNEGRLSDREGYWSWYNYPPGSSAEVQIFTNSNMNQMATVAAQLYEATGIHQYLTEALLVWKGDKQHPGIVQTLYKGNGRWEGKPGLAAFGKELPWEGSEYCSLGASLYRITGDTAIKQIVVATALRVTDPANGWVDPHEYYQIRMDGNGAFVNYLLDAYSIAPKELHVLMERIETMLTHVWTNHEGTATVVLHRESDNGIRNGWNPNGGEDGYGVDEVGTVHAQGEAMRAFGTFAYYDQLLRESEKKPAGRQTTSGG